MSCDTGKYRTSFGEMSYDTVKVSHTFGKSIAQPLKVSPSLKKCRAIIFSVVLKYCTGFEKNLHGPVAGTFWFEPNFLRVVFDTLFGVLQPYGVTFWIQVVSIQFLFCVFHCCPLGFKIYRLSIIDIF